MSRILALVLVAFIAGVPAAAFGEGHPFRELPSQTPKYDALSSSRKAFAQAGAVLFSFVTVPLRIATTVVLTPVYLGMKASDSTEEADQAEAFAQRYIVGGYAVRPEHLTGDSPYRFFGAGAP